jgi:hypothetical protein
MNIVSNNRSLEIATIFSFDVELFFGSSAGTTENCIVKPVESLLKLASDNKIHLTFFFDAGHLNFLERSKAKSVYLAGEYEMLIKLLRKMKKEGHDVQLHVHPHWEDTTFDGTWHFDTSHYSPDSYSSREFFELFGRYKASLDAIIEESTTAFRAGGFCLRGDKAYREIFSHYGIKVDSSIYFGGYEKSQTHFYDYRMVSRQPHWHFDDHPTCATEQGKFLAVPITSMYFSPVDFLKILATRKLKSDSDNFMGDGQGAAMSLRKKLTYLLKGDHATTSIDCGKSGLFERYRNDCVKRSCGLLHLIGHPKAISRKSLADMAVYCEKFGPDKIVTLSDYASQA